MLLSSRYATQGAFAVGRSYVSMFIAKSAEAPLPHGLVFESMQADNSRGQSGDAFLTGVEAATAKKIKQKFNPVLAVWLRASSRRVGDAGEEIMGTFGVDEARQGLDKGEESRFGEKEILVR